MNFQQALKIVNKAIYEKEGRGLTDPEVVVLKGSWENLTYEEMAEGLNYSANYLKGDMGHKFWKLLSEALGERVGKKNFKAALERARSRFLVEDATPDLLEVPDYSQAQIKESAAKAPSVSEKEVDPPRESSSKTEKCKTWQIVFKLDDKRKVSPIVFELDDIDDLGEIVKQLEKLGEGSMTVKRIEPGSIVLTVETAPEFYERINYLFNSGQLEEVLGILLLYILPPFPDELCLEFSELELHGAWSLKSDYSNPAARRNAWLNKLCFNKLATWLPGNVYKSQNLAILPAIWEVVNGSAIQLGKRRLVLIPCEAAKADELCVPQEWIDIPNWIGNYYLAVLVSQNSMRIWGYATHRQLKNEGRYDPNGRTYSLSGDVLGKLSQILEVPILDTKAAVDPLPRLYAAEIQTLLRQLGQASVEFPCLEIPFERWGALLQDENCRDQLYRRRLFSRKATNLSGWIEGIVEIGWQAVKEILGPPKFVGYQHRNGGLYIERAKLLDLERAREQIALLVKVRSESETEMDVLVAVYPSANQSYLPEMLELSVLDELAEEVMQTVARNGDNDIQLSFSGEVGEHFSLKVALGEVSVIETFVI